MVSVNYNFELKHVPANKESSGNANLKLVSEKKLCKVVENITTTSFSLAAKVIELISAYSRHGK